MADSAIKSDRRYIRNTIIPFLKDNGEKRIGQETLDYYKNFCIHNPDGDEIVVAEVTENDRIVSVSIAAIRNRSHVTFSTTVTDKSCRQKGYGKQALKAKIEELKRKGMGIRSIVAEDNISGTALCSKAGMRVVERNERLRKSGPYIAVIWTDPPQLAAD